MVQRSLSNITVLPTLVRTLIPNRDAMDKLRMM
jgi:hypothetical protein